jgi:oxygen-independent coproporphyrinogen-3 oxidase
MDPRVTTEAHLAALATFGFDHAWVGVEDYATPRQPGAAPELMIELSARALERARAAGFSSLAVDLVCGLAHHTAETFAGAVATVIDLGFDRVAIRSVARRSGIPRAIDAEARRRLLQAGYEPIGLDHFARSGDRLAAGRRDGTLRRSLGRYTAAYAGDCVGLGVGALSDVCGAYFQNARRLDDYEAALADWTLPIERGRVRDGDDEIRRRVIHDLLCHGRVDAREIETDLAVELGQYLASDLERLRRYGDQGLVSVGEKGIEVLPAGQPFGRELAECFDRRRCEPARHDNTLSFRRLR